jgi:hypothetical protein
LVAALFGVDLADGGAVALFMGGLAVGAASHHSTRGARMSLPP